MNNLKVSKSQHKDLLSLFPEAWREKLKLYTGEELYYAYRLCLFVGKRDKMTGDMKGGDVSLLSIRRKLIAWLKGERRPGAYGIMMEVKPLDPLAWAKLGKKWALDFEEDYIFTQPVAEQEELNKLQADWNARRVA